MKLPLLVNHDPTQVIGMVTPVGDRLHIEIRPEATVTVEQLITAFGAVRVLEMFVHDDGRRLVRRAEVPEFSIEGGRR